MMEKLYVRKNNQLYFWKIIVKGFLNSAIIIIEIGILNHTEKPKREYKVILDNNALVKANSIALKKCAKMKALGYSLEIIV